MPSTLNKLCGLYVVRPPHVPPPPASGDLISHPERPGDLDLWLFDFGTGARNVSRGTDNLLANFGVSATFCCRVMGNTHRTDDLTLLAWPLTFDVTAHVGDAGRRVPSLYQVWSSSVSHSEDMTIFRLSINWPSWPWPSTFRPLNRVTSHPYHGCHFQLPMPCHSRIRVRHGTASKRTNRQTTTKMGTGHNNEKYGENEAVLCKILSVSSSNTQLYNHNHNHKNNL